MKSPTITMERGAAANKLQQYEDAARRNPKLAEQLDRDIMQCYSLLAQGKRLIDVNEAIRAGGVDDAGRPKLAFGRAHVAQVEWFPSTRSTWNSSAQRNEYLPNGGGQFRYYGQHKRIDDMRTRWVVPAGTLSGIRDRSAKALTPIIPLPLRPRNHLANYYLLWEADWRPAPPIDPYLLRPVVGSIMEILAEWDLTPLEIAAARSALLNPAT